jgi:hypothetical protein
MDDHRRQMFHDSVDPVRDSGQLDLIDLPAAGLEVADSIQLIPAPATPPARSSCNCMAAADRP